MTNYEKGINSLINEADREAKEKVKCLGQTKEIRRDKKGMIYVWDFHAQFFHAAMNRLAKEAGLRQLD